MSIKIHKGLTRTLLIRTIEDKMLIFKESHLFKATNITLQKLFFFKLERLLFLPVELDPTSWSACRF